jgi:hyaluronan synthase
MKNRAGRPRLSPVIGNGDSSATGCTVPRGDFLAGLSEFFVSCGQRNVSGWLFFFAAVTLVLMLKLLTMEGAGNSLLFGGYSALVVVYILSRFLLAHFYRPNISMAGGSEKPTLSFGVPSKNEGAHIRETILRIAQSNYPKDKFDIIAVNDGSTDDTLEEMLKAKAEAAAQGVEVVVIDWQTNKGKREGMAECVRTSKNELLVFIDSDSFVEPDTVRELVRYFADARVAAVAGHAFVANSDANILTKMQAVRYFVAFKAFKSAEALFGSVICCSGCCSAYRRERVLEVLEEWKAQTFLGVRCTYGDDRSLTNHLLKKNYLTLYSPTATARTFVPDDCKTFVRQQLRWKKSWVRESLIASGFMWKRNPVMSVSFYLGVGLPLLAPIMVTRALFWLPFSTGRVPILYVSGLALMAVVFGLYYRAHIKDKNWIYGVLFAALFPVLLVWQLPWAILNIRDARWGTT